LSDPKDESLQFGAGDWMPGVATVNAGSVTELPDKLYFRIGEVAKLTGLKQHVLRFWETEFPAVAPKKMGSNHRMYRRKDVEVLLEIKHLLYEKRFTIEGARKHLEAKPKVVRGGRRNSGGVVSSQPMPKAATPPPRAVMPSVQSSLFGAADEEPPKAVAAGPKPKQMRIFRKELESILALLNS
jgi:DNA-binding transcriptional MerR regulator